MWEAMDASIGFVMGLLFAFAEVAVRAGTLRLEVGRKESKDWPLDYQVNRIGTDERAEIPLRGWTGVAPMHCQIVRQGRDFILDSLSHPSVAVNAQPVAGHVYLRHGDRVTVGSAALVFLTRGAASAHIRPPDQPRQVPLVAPAAAPTRTLRLVDQRGGAFDLKPGKHTIGRDSTNTITLIHEPTVSRAHAEIIVGNQIQVIDLGSSNGTFVNGHRVQSAWIAPGDSVSFGSAMLHVVG